MADNNQKNYTGYIVGGLAATLAGIAMYNGLISHPEYLSLETIAQACVDPIARIGEVLRGNDPGRYAFPGLVELGGIASALYPAKKSLEDVL